MSNKLTFGDYVMLSGYFICFAMGLLIGWCEATTKEVVEIETTTVTIETEIAEVETATTEIVQAVEPKLYSLGEFRVTYYCSCEMCCGKSDGITASGTIATINRTVAVDTDLIAFGTVLVINGKKYIAEDTGGMIKGNCIDVFVESHEFALECGVDYIEVWIIKN